ncbi:MAG: hypothetical protein R8K20_02015 [Gallionellaceae bacterium]
MAISNVGNTNQVAALKSINPTTPSRSAGNARSYGEQQPATIVTLSAQAKKLSMAQAAPTQTRSRQAIETPRTQTQTRATQAAETPRSQMQTRITQAQSVTQTANVATTKIETRAAEAAEPPAIQRQEPVERKRINTYA